MLIDRLLAREVGLCIAEDEDHIADVDDNDLRELASLLDDMIHEGVLTLYEYSGHQSVFEYLKEELREGWTHICSSVGEEGMLVGCKIGYFSNGAGKGASIITMKDLIEDSLSHKDGDDKDLKFDSVF